MYRLGIDLGGTNIVAGVVDEKTKKTKKKTKKTKLSQRQAVKQMCPVPKVKSATVWQMLH